MAVAWTALAVGMSHGVSPAVGHVDLFVFLAIGLLAGAHCLGMCGPLVTAYADRISAANRASRTDTLTLYDVRQHTLFNLGRATSYAVIGALFGLLGLIAFGSVEAVAAIGNRIRATVGIVVGIAIIAGGVYYVRGQAGLPHEIPIVGEATERAGSMIGRHIDRVATSPGIFGLGTIHGILPCPIIYPAYLYAFVLADPVRGGMALGVLGIGTIPTLFVYGTLVVSISQAHRVRLHRLLGLAFIILGYIPLQHGLMLLGIVDLPHPPIPFYDPLAP